MKAWPVLAMHEAAPGTRRLAALSLLGVALLTGGCATPTIRTQVTTFHEWAPAQQEKSYVFDRSKEQENNLEYRSYEDLVRTELARLGFAEATDPKAAKLKAALDYGMKVRDVRVVQPVVVNGGYPYFYGSAYRGYYGPYHGPFYGPFYRPYYYSPFYDPFWYGPPVVQQQESSFQVYTRQLKVTLARAADAKKLHETTVVSEGRNGSLAAVMPYMVRSAFADFPGQSGVPRQVELKMDKQ